MAFQFLCPQGHLLEGAESQMGQQAQCPYCGSVFVVPTLGAAPPAYPSPGQPYPGQQYPEQPAAPAGPGYGQPAYGQPGYGYPPAYAAPPAPSPAAPEPAVAVPAAAQPAAPSAAETKAPPPESAAEAASEAPPAEVADDANRVVRIPCPKGHELETPLDMIGMEALCPQCGEQFRLLYEDSVEYKEEQLHREERMNRLVLRIAIGAAGVIFLGLIILIVLAVRR